MFAFASFRSAGRGAAGAVAAGAGALGMALGVPLFDGGNSTTVRAAGSSKDGADADSESKILNGYEKLDDRGRLRVALQMKAKEGAAVRGPLHPKEPTPFRVVASEQVRGAARPCRRRSSSTRVVRGGARESRGVS